MGAVHLDAALLRLAVGHQLFGFGDETCHQILLEIVEVLDGGTILFVELIVAFGYGTGDDQRRSGVVDQYRVDLIDDGVVVFALYEVFGRRGHVVAQVVETVFVVRTEGDIGHVSLTAGVGVGLRIVDAGDRQTVEFVHRPHPFGVTLGQIVVDRYHVHALASQCVEEYGERCHEGLALARRHLGDLAFVEHHAAEELHVVVYHVPFDVVAAGQPVIGIDGLVAFDGYEILRCRELPVEIGSRYYDGLVFGEAACRILHDGERFGKNFVELLLDLFVDALGDFVALL